MAEEFRGAAEPLTKAGFDAAVAALKVEPASLWSVMMVETKGFGYQPDRHPKILFERHIFHQRTGGKFSALHPDLSNPEAGGYGPERAQYGRLARAMELDRQAALESASWGLAQVMGFNARSIGYESTEDMISRFMASESAQLDGMVRFLRANKLVRALADKAWATLARHYNGPDFAKNKYDQKLANFYRKCIEKGPPDIDLRADQIRLTYLGFDPKGVDGVPGNGTRKAVRAFQDEQHLTVTGELDGITRTRLKAAAGI